MFYELRMYHTNMGRIGDLKERMETLMPAVFRKHGFTPPLGHWIAVAGPTLPLYVWLLRWPDWDTRAKTYASIYGDADWARIRAETNGASEMVLKFDIQIMSETPAQATVRDLFADPDGAIGGLHEMRMIEAYPGKLGEAMKVLTEVDLPALKHCGARVLGVFGNESGLVTPGLTMFIAWDSFEARREGWRRFDALDTVRRQRRREHDELKTHLLGRYACHLLEPQSYGLPNAAFAARD